MYLVLYYNHKEEITKEIIAMTLTVLELMQMEYNSMAAKRRKLLKEVEQLEQQMDRLADRVALMSE